MAHTRASLAASWIWFHYSQRQQHHRSVERWKAMTHRAKATPPPKTPGRRVSGDPVDEPEHFIECPTCGHMIDMHALAEVLEHEGH
jgi:hypothetical protein